MGTHRSKGTTLVTGAAGREAGLRRSRDRSFSHAGCVSSGDVTHNNPTVVNNSVYLKPVKKVNLKCFHKEDERERYYLSR